MGGGGHQKFGSIDSRAMTNRGKVFPIDKLESNSLTIRGDKSKKVDEDEEKPGFLANLFGFGKSTSRFKEKKDFVRKFSVLDTRKNQILPISL